MNLEKNVPLQPYNTFGIAAKAHALVRVHSEADLLAVLADPQLASSPRQVLGGGSNIVLTGDVKALVLKMEVPGISLVGETDKNWLIEAGAGVDWHA
ncbi:MAG: FAD-binding protein, partial [Limnohabitans sp.]|nr:FAD-binding protein [Limnohabitans sp.]